MKEKIVRFCYEHQTGLVVMAILCFAGGMVAVAVTGNRIWDLLWILGVFILVFGAVACVLARDLPEYKTDWLFKQLIA